MSSIDPHIFRAYDIRGKANEQVTEEACTAIGRAFGTELREQYSIDAPTVAAGRDARTHSPALEAAVVRGLKQAGCTVLRIGQVPSPVSYFTICDRNLDGSVQVTASHNGPQDNGLKLQIRHAEAFAGEDLQQLRRQIENGHFLAGKGAEEEIDAITPYLARRSALFPGIGAGIHVVIDTGNGVAGPAYCEALRCAGCTVTELYTEPDGTFPNHPADPSKWETLKELQETVRKNGAHFGMAFDGDGDRLGIVDEQGTIRTADEVLLLLARDHLSRHPGAPVIFTVSNSGILDSEIRKWGGNPVMCKVGHSFVEHAMREHRALLGGEQSGHFFCGEGYYEYDDALVAGLRVLKIAAGSGEPFSALFREFPKVFQAPERRPHCPDDKKGAVIRQATAYFLQAGYPVNTLDGARIDFGEGAWAGIRQSNTSPRLSICMEARTAQRLHEMEEAVLGHMRSYPEITW